MRKIINKIILVFLTLELVCGCASNQFYSEKSDVATETESPTPKNIEHRTLRIDNNDGLYSYDDMVYDLETFCISYGDLVSLEVVAKTLDGRNIYDVVVGDKNAQKHVVIHAAIHAREYITSKLVMKQLSHYLSNLHNKTGQYNGMIYTELFDGVAVHVIPMVNPDGVSLSQYGADGLLKPATKERVEEILKLNGSSIDSGEFRNWKANANGVDLNRNFDALWEEFGGAGKPAPDRYKGTSPGSEPETKALIDITTKNPVKRTISYHTSGEVIYWYFGQEGELYNSSKMFAEQISKVTTYPMDANYENLDPAGYKDWALYKLGIPSITIEVGSGMTPVSESQIDSIYNQNINVWSEMLYQLKMED